MRNSMLQNRETGVPRSRIVALWALGLLLIPVAKAQEDK